MKIKKKRIRGGGGGGAGSRGEGGSEQTIEVFVVMADVKKLKNCMQKKI